MDAAVARKLIRRPEVEARIGLTRSPLYARIKAGTFPAPVPLGGNAVGWVEAEVDAWIAGQIAKRDAESVE